MLKIGLTGGIGSGKTTVSDHFAKLGVPVIDADVISRELTQHPGPVLNAISAQFGEKILNPDGSLNRRALRQRVFNKPKDKAALEAIIHPAVRTEINRQINALNSEYCIISIPLLFESNLQSLVDRVLVIDAEPSEQVNRTTKRDQTSTKDVEKIIAQQIDRKTRLSMADDVIHNSGDLDHLYTCVDRQNNNYLRMVTTSKARLD